MLAISLLAGCTQTQKDADVIGIIGAISDKPNETEFVDYTVFEAQAAERCAKIVLYMVEII